MINEPLVTIAIPFYNSEDFLSYAILSVLNQSYRNWELLLLDDGSTDSSLSIAKSFTDERIVIYSDENNFGLVYRLNQSVLLAKGDYYARMDADDIMHSNRIARQVAFLQVNQQIDLVGTSWYSINDKNEIISKKNPPKQPDQNDIYYSICFLHPSILGKKDWFISNKYDDRFLRIEDYELWLRTISHSHFENILEPLMFYREFGMPHLKKYTRTQLSSLLIYSRYKVYHMPLLLSVKLRFKAFFKILIYGVFSLIGKVDFLIKLRTKDGLFFLRLEAQEDLEHAISKTILMQS